MLALSPFPLLLATLPFLTSNVQPIDAAGWGWAASDSAPFLGKLSDDRLLWLCLSAPPSTRLFFLIYVSSIGVFGFLGKTITFSFASKI